MQPLVTNRHATVAIIPARYASNRFPGKPLVDLDGVPMIVRVAMRVRECAKIDQLVVATDHTHIRDVVARAGFRALMTPAECASGTDRVAHAFEWLQKTGVTADLVLNVQGDEPLIDPRDIDALIGMMQALPGAKIGTLARPLQSEAELASKSTVKVVTRSDGRALYFSRAPIPHGAEPSAEDPARRPLLHVGIYAYRPEVLSAFVALGRSPLEILESLEQLRALENGIDVYVARCVSEHPSVAIDVPEDVDKVMRLLGSARSKNATH